MQKFSSASFLHSGPCRKRGKMKFLQKFRCASFLHSGPSEKEGKMRNNFLIMFLILCFFPACGYRFTGGELFLPEIKSIHIAVFENRTAEPGLEALFADDLINEFTKRSSLVLTDKNNADAVLSGEIRSLEIKAISRKGANMTLERQVRLVAEIKLTDSQGKLLWSGTDMSDTEAYPVLSETMATEHRRENALAMISKRLAETVYNRLTDNF